MVVSADEIQALSPLTLRSSSSGSSNSSNGLGDTGISNMQQTVSPTGKQNSRVVTATGYCPCKICCEKYSYEVTGVPNHVAGFPDREPKANHTLAVDPNMIPYGTEVIIKGSNGYDGVYVAEDKGGAIKEDGKSQIDVYFNTHKEALNFGRRMITIYW